jgi:hypothetical protein
MTPAELQQLLITRAPDVPGITAAARRDDENPYGLTVTLAGGGRAWWAITSTSPDPAGPTRRSRRGRPAASARVPVARVEQALIAVAVTRAPGGICRVDRYSTRPDPARRALRRYHRLPRRLEALPVLLRHHPPRPAASRPALPPHSHI